MTEFLSDISRWNLVFAAASPFVVVLFLAVLREVFDYTLHWSLCVVMMLFLFVCAVLW